ncbi:hypothetical protein ANO11243_009000 [Dothideomycetidae sp. 11243]|nr:hypothetical protein ANO11243_009000 [fungal sp. No.11243]
MSATSKITGHYSYECKSAIQERPYQSRPSRSQQLLNPRLRQALTNQSPSEPLQRQHREGLADAILERSAEERREKRKMDRDEDHSRSRKRSRSVSSDDSVSTISTNRSLSPRNTALDSAGARHPATILSQANGMKRRRSRSGSTSWEGGPSGEGDRRTVERHTRHRRRSSSPKQRGRRQERSPSSERAVFSHSHTHSGSRSRSRNYHSRERSKGMSRRETRNTDERDRHRSLSPYSKRTALARAIRQSYKPASKVYSVPHDKFLRNSQTLAGVIRVRRAIPPHAPPVVAFRTSSFGITEAQ